MGWIYTDLHRNRLTLEDALEHHVSRASWTSQGIICRLLAYEWRNMPYPKAFYGIVEQDFRNADEGREKGIQRFLICDLIEASAGSFGYKGMDEHMGPHMPIGPSEKFKIEIFKHIPHAKGYAADFRTKHGIPYTDPAQIEMFA